MLSKEAETNTGVDTGAAKRNFTIMISIEINVPAQNPADDFRER